jgi:hypothetical protein
MWTRNRCLGYARSITIKKQILALILELITVYYVGFEQSQ